MRLYEIDAAIAALADEDGEITDYEALEALVMERDRKIENLACMVKDQDAMIVAIREEKKRLDERLRRLEASVARKKDYLGRVLNGEKFSSARCQIGWRTSTATVVDDEAAALEWAVNEKQQDCYTVKVSLAKAGIGELLKAGREIPGARLEERLNISIK